LRAPLLSLPLLLDTRLATIPGSVPYLHAHPEQVARWSQRIGPRTELRVGLAWSGGMLLENDRNRSIALAHLSALLSRPLDWICLQKEIREPDRDEMRKHPTLRQFSEELDDFEDTAALIELCDLVIAVDTAVAHLAGALAKPVWLLLPALPDWRWMLEREDSPWYPTLRLFRQTTIGDWSVPLDRMAHDLDLLVRAQG